MLQILVKNVFFVENLLVEYFCRKSILINMELLLGQTNQLYAFLDQGIFCLKYLKGEAKPNPCGCSRRIVFLSRILGFACVLFCEPFLCHLDASLGRVSLCCTCDPSPKL